MRTGQKRLHFLEYRLGSDIPQKGAVRGRIEAAMNEDFGLEFDRDSVQLAALQFLCNDAGQSVIIWATIIAEGEPRFRPGTRGLQELRGTGELRNRSHRSIADVAFDSAMARRRVVRPSPPSLTGWPQRVCMALQVLQLLDSEAGWHSQTGSSSVSVA